MKKIVTNATISKNKIEKIEYRMSHIWAVNVCAKVRCEQRLGTLSLSTL